MAEIPKLVQDKMEEVAGCCEIMGDLQWDWFEDEDGYHRVHIRPAVTLVEGMDTPTYPGDIRWDISALMSIFDEVKDMQWMPEGKEPASLSIEAWDGVEWWITIHEAPEENAEPVAIWSGNMMTYLD